MLRILDVTLQTRSTTHTGVRPLSARGLRHRGLDPERGNQNKKDEALRLIVFRVKKVPGVGVPKARENSARCIRLQHFTRVLPVWWDQQGFNTGGQSVPLPPLWFHLGPGS